MIVCSQGEARALLHSYIGTEHLLLGCLRVEIGVAARALQSLNVTLAGARSAVAEMGSEIDTEHLLLGLFEENEGVGARVLRDAGIDAEMIRAAVERTPRLDMRQTRLVELVPDLRAAISEPIEAVAKAKQIAVSLEDARRARVIDEAERLLTQTIG